MAAQTKIPGLRIYILIAVFFLPMLMSWVLYEYNSKFDLHTSNKGTFVEPNVQEQKLLDASAAPTWQMAYAPSNCLSQKAQETMYTLHQVREALGKNSKRVSLSLLSADPCAVDENRGFRKIAWDGKPLQAALADHQMKDKIFLIDPHGNVFMYYHENTNGMDILKDMMHLLEVSQIG
jgi:hypothetical protein